MGEDCLSTPVTCPSKVELPSTQHPAIVLEIPGWLSREL